MTAAADPGRLPPKLILISTPPRCGSMWLYNACKQVLRSAGRDAQPDDVQLTQNDLERTLLAAGRDRDPRRVFVAKTHDVIGPAQDGVVIATVFRDPRDMALSFRKFMGESERAVAIHDRVASMIESYRNLERINAGALVRFDYADIVSRPVYALGVLRAALGFKADAAADRAIADDLSPERVKRIVAGAEVDPDLGRALDRRTGFQTGHVRGDGDDAWRREIAPADLALIDAQFGDWLDAHGFART